jgi:DNA polymerase-3 subunit alpha
MGALKRKGIHTFAEVQKMAERQASVARIAGTVAYLQQRKNAKGTRYGFVGLSDPTGLFETMVFSDVLDATRDMLVPGMNVVVTVEATSEAEQLRLLCRSVQPVDSITADAGGAGLRVFVDRAEAIAAVASLLERAKTEVSSKSRGAVTLCLLAPDLPGEVEVSVGEGLPVNPQIKGALKSLQGVVTVEEF